MPAPGHTQEKMIYQPKNCNKIQKPGFCPFNTSILRTVLLIPNRPKVILCFFVVSYAANIWVVTQRASLFNHLTSKSAKNHNSRKILISVL